MFVCCNLFCVSIVKIFGVCGGYSFCLCELMDLLMLMNVDEFDGEVKRFVCIDLWGVIENGN